MYWVAIPAPPAAPTVARNLTVDEVMQGQLLGRW